MFKSQKTEILEQAAEWLMRMKQRALNEQERQQFEQWQNRSRLHQKIWHKAIELEQKFQQLPPNIVIPVIQKQALKSHLNNWLLVLGLLPTVYLIYLFNQQQQWTADYRSGTGQQKTVPLSDGGKILLNANSAIDVEYTGQKRNIVLRKGEIWIETHHDSQHRPFIVYTQQGQAQALGTKYLVKMDENHSYVAVVKGAVKVQPQDDLQHSQILSAGQQTVFNQNEIQSVKDIDYTQLAWTKGLIVVDEMPLSQFVKRLQAYQHAVIYVDPDISQIKISGTYPINDMPQIYAMLEQTYSIQVDHYAMNHFIRIHSKNN
ncbi:FecR domain-containing protein [Acinetobacter ursingii]|uniref:FecR domain-containing protein n=1 Tax=Acinetobacter ursingii TaxID=108980 RepID=A0AA46S9D6_9GAMM|nr:FecR domain-containing protein [Acinetobacter ursingii]MCU4603458.1 FecR domain-containing protein [Acinetobacter ursingii]MDH2020293.1 FecR domain-containing protein [Acinetobacter ursingii]MDH2072607.1 FecR domain-containing protein [Acinetobacter ursingii]UYF76498.1 FecR domain-containing protein [Acinetobacter ursingii]